MSARHDYPPVDPYGVAPFTAQAEQWIAMCGEIDRLRALVADMAEELDDIRSQWGDDYLWQKHNEHRVVDLLARANREEGDRT